MVSCKILLPSPNLQKWVNYYWYSEGGADLVPARYMVIGDGAPGIIFQLGACSIYKKDGMAMPMAFVYGQATEYCENDIKNQPLILGIQFKHGALQAISKENAHVLTNTIVELDSLFTVSEIDQLVNQTTIDSLISSFELLLLQKFNQQKHTDTLITFSTQMIDKNIHHILASQLSKELNLSGRQFQRRFKQVVGLPAETYIRIKKVQKARQMMYQGAYPKLSDIAYTLNYADQSHFIREFRQFAGLTPTYYAKKERELPMASGQLPFPVRKIIPC